jgi:Lipoprotein amino terminal region
LSFITNIILFAQLRYHLLLPDPLKNPGLCGISTCDIDTDDAKFRYQSNIVYKYLYESSFNSLFEGTDNNDPVSELHISAFVELHFPQKCQGYLRVHSPHLKHRNLTIHSEPIKTDYEYEDNEEETVIEEPAESFDPKDILHAKSEMFKKDIEDTHIWFDFRNGLIQEICHDTEEQVWVTNFKRGILSALQNTMERLDLDHKATEVDVSGKCDVSYEFIGGFKSSIKVKKIKHITTCQNRNKFKSIVQTTPYEFGKKGISWWPIYDSTSYCEVMQYSMLIIFVRKNCSI